MSVSAWPFTQGGQPQMRGLPHVVENFKIFQNLKHVMAIASSSIASNPSDGHQIWADASADGNEAAVPPHEYADLVAKAWQEVCNIGRVRKLGFVVPSVRTPATGADNLHPPLHLKHVYDDPLRTIAMIMTRAANVCSHHHGLASPRRADLVSILLWVSLMVALSVLEMQC